VPVVAELTVNVQVRSALENIIGNSQPMQRALQSVKDVAQTEATVLIHGESGTGKELVAQAIHYISKRKDCPFVAFNCSALNESIVENELFGHVKGAFTNAIDDHRGLFEVANHGTLFLDEIGDMPLSIQAKLLRALQQGEIIRVGSTEVRKIDVRVIAATNKKLEELIQKKEFREDLYYRLNVINLDLPSLRERKDDIELLSLYFLDKYKRKNNKRIHSISPEVLQVLKDYSWPGNVRELENTISRAVILEKKDVIQLPSLPQSMIQKSVKQASFTKSEGTILNIMSKSLRDAKQQVVDDFEKRYLDVVLKRVEGNISQAANLAGIERSNFRKLLTNKGIDIQKYKKTN
jgi:transcriptional regulator with PAS, ATPase and Fis domain